MKCRWKQSGNRRKVIEHGEEIIYVIGLLGEYRWYIESDYRRFHTKTSEHRELERFRIEH